MDWREVLAAAQAVPPPRPALDEVVASRWPGAVVTDVRLLDGGLGSVLHRVDVDGGPRPALVLRQLLRAFGDDGTTVLREAEVHRAAGAAGLPVPAVHWVDPEGEVLGRPALLVDLVPGRPLVTDLHAEAGRRHMATILHAVADVPVGGLAHVPRLEDLDAVVNRFFPPPTTSDVVDAAALNAVVARAAGSFVAGGRLVHMDLHAGNVLWDGRAVTGVLDWPGASIGNPLADEAYLWFDTCLAHGREVGDRLQTAVDDARRGPPPSPDELHLWRGVALQRGLPSPRAWVEAYRAMDVDVDEDTVEARFVALVEEHLGRD